MAAANDAMPTPDSTTYHRQRGEHGIRPFDTLPTGQLRAIRQTRSKVSPTALRFAGRAVRQYVDSTIGGYSPSLTSSTIAIIERARHCPR